MILPVLCLCVARTPGFFDTSHVDLPHHHSAQFFCIVCHCSSLSCATCQHTCFFSPSVNHQPHIHVYMLDLLAHVTLAIPLPVWDCNSLQQLEWTWLCSSDYSPPGSSIFCTLIVWSVHLSALCMPWACSHALITDLWMSHKQENGWTQSVQSLSYTYVCTYSCYTLSSIVLDWPLIPRMNALPCT